jgi:hypothetical protein
MVGLAAAAAAATGSHPLHHLAPCQRQSVLPQHTRHRQHSSSSSRVLLLPLLLLMLLLTMPPTVTLTRHHQHQQHTPQVHSLLAVALPA